MTKVEYAELLEGLREEAVDGMPNLGGNLSTSEMGRPMSNEVEMALYNKCQGQIAPIDLELESIVNLEWNNWTSSKEDFLERYARIQ